jgi:hypothetical protein
MHDNCLNTLYTIIAKKCPSLLTDLSLSLSLAHHPYQVMHPAAAAAAQADVKAWEAATSVASQASSSAPLASDTSSSGNKNKENVLWNAKQQSHVVYTEGRPHAAKVDRQCKFTGYGY